MPPQNTRRAIISGQREPQLGGPNWPRLAGAAVVAGTPDPAMGGVLSFFQTAFHRGPYTDKVYLTKASSLPKICGSNSHLQTHKHRLPRQL